MRENKEAALLAIPMELARIANELTAGLQEFHNGQRVNAARFVDVGRAPLLWGGACRLVGWSLRAGTGASVLTLRNGRDDSAEMVAIVDLAADESATIWLGPTGVAVGEALWVTIDGAAVEGVFYLGAVD